VGFAIGKIIADMNRLPPSITTTIWHAVHTCFGLPAEEAKSAIERGLVQIDGRVVSDPAEFCEVRVDTQITAKRTRLWLLPRHLMALASPLHRPPGE